MLDAISALIWVQSVGEYAGLLEPDDDDEGCKETPYYAKANHFEAAAAIVQ